MKINSVYSAMRSCYHDWQDYLLNPIFVQNGNEITWGNRKPGTQNSTVRLSDVRRMDDEGQYTYLIEEDRSVVQLFYGFNPNSDEISAARLAYYSGDEEQIDDDLKLMNHGVIPFPDERSTEDILLVDTEGLYNPPVGWMRIDYDPSAREIGVLHPICHMHFSSFPESRFIVRGVPSPRQFMEFIFCSLYPNTYRRHRLERRDAEKDSKPAWISRDTQLMRRINGDNFPFKDDPTYKLITHVFVPGLP